MIDVNKPLAIHNGHEARFIGRSNNAMYPLVMESRSKTSGQWFVFPCTEDGNMMQGGRVINVVNENLPEEW